MPTCTPRTRRRRRWRGSRRRSSACSCTTACTASSGRGEWVHVPREDPGGRVRQAQGPVHGGEVRRRLHHRPGAGGRDDYVNITARHHDSFCLFGTKQTDFNSVDARPGATWWASWPNSVARRAWACSSITRTGSIGGIRISIRAVRPIARPTTRARPATCGRKDADFARYIEFVHGQIKELLVNYGPLAGIWFDPIMGYYARPDLFPIHETYAMIRRFSRSR